MNEQTAALDALRAAVEAGKGGDAVGYYAARVFNLGYTHAINAYHGSLDAARALHDALLPGWDMQINTYEDDSFEASVSQPLQVKTYDGVSPFMARAWLLAILRARRSQVNHD